MKLDLFNIFCIGIAFISLLIAIISLILSIKLKNKDKECPNCGTINKKRKTCEKCNNKLKYTFPTILLITAIIFSITFAGISIFTGMKIYKNNATQTNIRNENVEQLKVLTEYINIRESKSVSSNIIGQVKHGEIYTILSSEPESEYKWYEIETSNRIHGFIAGHSNGNNYVEVLSTDTTEKEEQIENNTDNKTTTTKTTTKKKDNNKKKPTQNNSNTTTKKKEENKIETTTTNKKTTTTTTTTKKTDKTESNKKVIEATKKYSCSFYYDLDSVTKLCTKESYTSDSSIRKLVCPSGYEPDSGKNCKAIIKDNVKPTEKMACSDGSTPDYINNQYYCRSGQLYVNRVCPSGYRLISSGVGGITSYMCEWKTRGYTKGYYTCSTGYKLASNDLCFKVVTKDPDIEYSCPYGYTLKEDKCYEN